MTNPASKASGVVVIAEIGVNHNGSLPLARRLIDCAADAGADYAKFQTFSAKHLASEHAQVAEYQKQSYSGERQVDLLASLELPQEDFEEIADYCESQSIGFLTTAHDMESARFVFDLDLDFVKVPSGDVTNYPFLKIVGEERKPVLLSTGASSHDEVAQALEVIEQSGLPRSLITVMQCTTEYPAPVDEANLLAMVEMGREWGVNIGYSDHTIGPEATVAAVALGARVIEKHITLDKSMEGPDHRASSVPEEFAQMVRAVRQVEKALGSQIKVVTPAEASNQGLIRKSIVASRAIRKGETLTEENLSVMRPADGLSPMEWPQVVGTRATMDYRRNERIQL